MKHNSKSSDSIRTPLAKVRGLGSARSGTHHFWQQRLTGLANVPLTIAFVGIVMMLSKADYASSHAVVANPFVALLLLLFVGAGMAHMRLGMQVVIEDYVHSEGAKVLLLMLNTFFCVATGLAAAYALLRIGFAA